MRPRSFYISALIAVALFGLMNVAAVRMGRHTIPREIAKRLETTPGLNTVALGNSLMEAGFNPSVFASAGQLGHGGLIAVNAGMGSSYPVEHLLLLRHALQARRNLQWVMYGFFDFQLMERPNLSLSEVIGNRAMLYYFEPQLAARYYNWPLWDLAVFHATRLIPLLAERGAVWAKVEKFRRQLGELGMPKHAVNRFGRAQDFSLMESGNPESFALQCDQAVRSHRELSAPVLDMIRLTREHGARMVMIEMPMSPTHVTQFYSTPSWKRYRAYLKSLLASHGADYIEAGSWITDERLFDDHLHLSVEGSTAFSQKLATATL